ncbi:MAG: hypothetical protein RR337_12355, partial [Clostridia bacterium]
VHQRPGTALQQQAFRSRPLRMKEGISLNTPAPRCKHVKLGAPRPLVNQADRAAPDRAMRKYFFLNGGRATAKAAATLLGESDYQYAVAAARVTFFADPRAVYAVDTPGGRLTIVFRSI